MATENHDETSNGWPLGLQIMTIRLRLEERVQAAAPAIEPYSLQFPSSSTFSSFSSSNLDTQSSASFFQDKSVSLGKLIRFRQRDRGSMYFRNIIHGGESKRIPTKGACCKDNSRRHSADMSQGICIPLILGALVKISRNRSKSKRLDVSG